MRLTGALAMCLTVLVATACIRSGEGDSALLAEAPDLSGRWAGTCSGADVLRYQLELKRDGTYRWKGDGGELVSPTQQRLFLDATGRFFTDDDAAPTQVKLNVGVGQVEIGAGTGHTAFANMLVCDLQDDRKRLTCNAGLYVGALEDDSPVPRPTCPKLTFLL